jgi:hypothetical protein
MSSWTFTSDSHKIFLQWVSSKHAYFGLASIPQGWKRFKATLCHPKHAPGFTNPNHKTIMLTHVPHHRTQIYISRMKSVDSKNQSPWRTSTLLGGVLVVAWPLLSLPW